MDAIQTHADGTTTILYPVVLASHRRGPRMMLSSAQAAVTRLVDITTCWNLWEMSQASAQWPNLAQYPTFHVG